MADGEEFSRVSHLFIIPIFYFNFSQFHGGNLTDSDNVIPRNLTPEVLQALRAVRFIAQHIKDADKDNEVGTQRRSVPPPSPAYFCCPFLLTRGRVSSSRRCGEEAGSPWRCYCLHCHIFGVWRESFASISIFLFYYCLLPLTST